MTTVTNGATWLADWQEWHLKRLNAVTALTGASTLTGTYWLDGPNLPQQIDGLPGEWFVEGDRVIGTGAREGAAAEEAQTVTDWDGEVSIALVLGSDVTFGERVIRSYRRGDQLALRTFDPQAITRTGFQDIETFEPSVDWRFEADFVADGNRQVEVSLVDGYQHLADVAGEIVFEHAGQEYRLLATGSGTQFSVVFGDATNGSESYRFRFLPVAVVDGKVDLDFNRAILPPCAFSDHWVCPIPDEQNRLPFPVRAGEARVRRVLG